MTDEDFQDYLRVRQYLRLAIAVAVGLKDGNVWSAANYFTIADDYLTQFEMNRK